MNSEPKYGTDRDLENRYGFKRRYWQRQRFFGTGPLFRKVGKLCLYEFAEVDRWLAAQPLMQSTVERAHV